MTYYLLRLILGSSLALATSAFAQTGQPPSPCVNDDGRVLYPGNGVTVPRAIFNSDLPHPPPPKKGKKLGGTAILGIIVGKDGHVCDARVVRSFVKDKQFDKKVVDAVKGWKFEHAQKNGKPVAVEFNLEIDFHLQKDSGL